jgi:regulator of sirC expression with transglutaminase-like and TPR domain
LALEIKEIEAMLYLLDDTDVEIVDQIENKLLDMGSSILPILEEHWQSDNLTVLHHERIFSILHKIKSSKILEEIVNWKSQADSTVIKGAFLIAKAFNPNVEYKSIENEIESLRMDVWIQLQNNLSAWERIRVLNDVFFQKYKYQGNREDYHSKNNSLIDEVIKNKKGSPVSLSILYLSVAQRLNLPVFGVNLPQHFVMAFMPSDFEESTGDFSEKYELNKEDFIGEPLFYIDAFSEGLPFDKDRLETFLEEVKIKPQSQFYYPCNNLEIIQRIVRNLKYSFNQKGDEEKIELIEKISLILS